MRAVQSLAEAAVVLVFPWVFLSGLPLAHGQGTIPIQKYALLIGINEYTKPLGHLEFCENDISELQKSLLAIGFAEENVVLMCNGASDPRYRPSKINITTELNLLLEMANEEDLVLVAFSGHGLHVDGVSYLCPFDAKLEDASETMVSVKDLYARLEACKAGQKVLLVDACRNEPLLRGFRAPGGLKGFADELTPPPRGVWLLTSCAPGQWSAEDPALKHGVFMYYALEALKGKADEECAGNHDGNVTLDELFSYANQRTMNHVRRSHGTVQKPMREGTTDGDYVIAATLSVPRKIEAVETVTPEPAAVVSTEGTAAEPPSNVMESPLLLQGDTYLEKLDYANAITAYSGIIDNSSLPNELRLAARKRRSAAYLARGGKSDLDAALLDQQAAGLEGIRLTVRKQSSPLKIGKEVKGTVVRNQVVLVTLANGDWLWVKSINDDSTLQGYISKDAVIEPQATPRTSVVTQPKPNYQYPQGGWPNDYQGRPPSIWETPEWETPAQIREGRANGTLR